MTLLKRTSILSSIHKTLTALVAGSTTAVVAHGLFCEMLRRKGTHSMAQVTTSKSMVAEAPARPRRALGVWASIALVIGNMIG
jgi:hypothetical protein